MRRRLALSLALALALVVLLGAVVSVDASSPPNDGGISPTTRFTPIAGSVLSRPTPVLATDGRYHLAYELELTNATTFNLQVTSIAVRNARTQQVLATLTGASLAAALRPVGSAAAEDSPEPPAPLLASSTAIVWLDVSTATRSELPTVFDHQVLADVVAPPAGPPSFDVVIGRTFVRRDNAIVLNSPVAPGTWLMSEGCCTDYTHHRRGFAPINGELLVPQRFAIDFYKMNDAHQTWIGDPSDVNSYLSYNVPIISSTAGEVVAARDGLPDQSPPEPPPLPPIADTVGNHVIVKVADGVYLLYAHMKPGSVRVRKGDYVETGQRLGLIGTSGNSTTPHLHFQVLTTPTFFPADSTPFVFRGFDLVGKVTARIWDDNLGLQPTGTLPFADAVDPGPRREQMPLDRDVIVFRGGKGYR